MVIEVVPEQLYALAGVLDAAASRAAQAGTGLAAGRSSGGAVGGPLGEAVVGFCETAQTAAGCLDGELVWLGRTVAAAADSWLGLDARLLRGVPQ
jgi:hypothetical protein